ncbi:MAG: hypothetical protein Q8Q06_00270 [bacterium]|nr:hypothetical protein [bacterium]
MSRLFLAIAMLVVIPVGITGSFIKYKKWLKQEKTIRKLHEGLGNQVIQRKPSKVRDALFLIGMAGELFHEIFIKSPKKGGEKCSK